MYRIAHFTAAALAFLSIAVIGNAGIASASQSATMPMQHVPASGGTYHAQMPEPEAPESNDVARLFVFAGVGMLAVGSVLVVRGTRPQRANVVHAPIMKSVPAIAV